MTRDSDFHPFEVCSDTPGSSQSVISETIKFYSKWTPWCGKTRSPFPRM